jgi:hypothetical protein
MCVKFGLSLTKREEHRLGVFENRVLRRIFGGLKRENVEGNWRRLHNEELHTLYAWPNIITVIKSGTMRWERHEAGIQERRHSYRVFVGNYEGEIPL